MWFLIGIPILLSRLQSDLLPTGSVSIPETRVDRKGRFWDRKLGIALFPSDSSDLFLPPSVVQISFTWLPAAKPEFTAACFRTRAASVGSPPNGDYSYFLGRMRH